jgi:tetratricopeptide (TPR) repeat protein
VAVAAEIGETAVGPAEEDADRRLRSELDNLRAARDVARAHGRHDVPVALTLALADVMIWRDLREIWDWALELASDPVLTGHPREAAVLGCAAEAARLLGELDRAQRLAERAIAVAGPHGEGEQVTRAWSALASVAHFRGDFPAARDRWERAAQGRSHDPGMPLASAALAAAYGGDPATARRLLDATASAVAACRCPSHAAFVAYVEGELCAAQEPERAVRLYQEAIDLAGPVGATFVEGVASVALASVRARSGDLAGAAAGFGVLLGSWRRTGQGTQLWTTARNAAGLLARTGHRRTAAMLVLCADRQPGAAAVSPTISRHSGRAFVDVDDLLPAAELDRARAEVVALGPDGVLAAAREALAQVAGGVPATPPGR